MVESRRAASPQYVVVVKAALAVISLALGAVLALWGGIAVRMARKVVTPAARIPDCRILELDTSAQTITLTRTPDTELAGRYGLFTTGTERYLKLGSVLSETADTVNVVRRVGRRDLHQKIDAVLAAACDEGRLDGDHEGLLRARDASLC